MTRMQQSVLLSAIMGTVANATLLALSGWGQNVFQQAGHAAMVAGTVILWGSAAWEAAADGRARKQARSGLRRRDPHLPHVSGREVSPSSVSDQAVWPPPYDNSDILESIREKLNEIADGFRGGGPAAGAR
jgi:hypothetical protein